MRNLHELMNFNSTGQLARGFKSKRIPQRRQQVFSNWLQRSSQAQLQQCILSLANADRSYKSGQSELSWIQIESVLLTLAGKTMASQQQMLNN